jgi:hypothetical protein
VLAAYSQVKRAAFSMTLRPPCRADPQEVGKVTIEIEIPDGWPPGLGLAVAKMMQQSLKDGFPVVVPVRRDATPDQLEAAFNSIKTVIHEAGLTV